MKTQTPNQHLIDARRTESGALDIAYYERQARQLRAQTFRHGIGAMITLARKVWQRIRSRMSEAAAQRELSQLDTHALKDIGLGQSDFAAIANGTFLSDDSRRRRAARLRRIA